MRRANGLCAAAVLIVLAAPACGPDAGDPATGRAIISADTVDPALLKPGSILRFGPADPEVAARPPEPPVVEGDRGQVSIYEGYFLRGPCSLPLRVDADLQGDTILVRVVSEPDPARLDTCDEGARPTGYAVLVGQFEPDDYAVHVVHEGDGARPTPLDTIYENITVTSRSR